MFHLLILQQEVVFFFHLHFLPPEKTHSCTHTVPCCTVCIYLLYRWVFLLWLYLYFYIRYLFSFVLFCFSLSCFSFFFFFAVLLLPKESSHFKKNKMLFIFCLLLHIEWNRFRSIQI